MSRGVLVLNAGSSSLKFSVFNVESEAENGLDLVVRGQVEGLGRSPRFVCRGGPAGLVAEEAWTRAECPDHQAALARLLERLDTRLRHLEVIAVGHRVVHGGSFFSGPVRVDDEVVEQLESLVSLAPLHQPHNLAGIRAVQSVRPGVPQVACFDTAFHRGHSPVVDRFALPAEYFDAGVRRYGFHGLSYEYIAQHLREVAPPHAEGKVVVAHLGSGASLCAMEDGRSVDSTMGFSALDGLPMGTRCGSLDPGVILYLLQVRGLEAEEIEDLLYRRSGLLGLSGSSHDMRDLLASDYPAAELAIDHFAFSIARELGALVAVLGGLDALVFTAGIGANSPEIRNRVCQRSRWLGVELDDAANGGGGPRISPEGSTPSVWVLPTNEGRMIAQHTVAVVG